MNDREFDAWCASATEKIRYRPDREMVSKELRDHLEDRYDALLAGGATSEEATAKALEAMGSAKEIAPQLGAIHRPWLGYLVSVAKAVAIVSVVFIVFAIPRVLLNYSIAVLAGNRTAQLDSGATMIICEADAEGYHFTMEHSTASDRSNRLYFQLTVRWLPGTPQFGAIDHFYAVDSNGNFYASMDNRTQVFDRSSGRWLRSGGGSTGNGYCSYALSLTEFDWTAQWVELHYDRDGRDIVLRIDLTGGEPVG